MVVIEGNSFDDICLIVSDPSCGDRVVFGKKLNECGMGSAATRVGEVALNCAGEVALS